MQRFTVASLTLVGVGAAAVAIAIPAFAGDGPLPAELQDVRAAIARYHSFEQAERDGYTVQGEPCVASPDGTMGIHAINPPLLASGAIDPLQPEILLYVRKANGNMTLVGVEYWKIALANTASGPAPWFGPTPPPGGFFTPTPELFGRAFDGPMEGHNPPPPAPQEMPWHYDLHVWVAEANPSGLFAMFNPAIAC